MIDNNTTKFTGLAKHYAKYRPSYSTGLLDYLYTEAGFTQDSLIADVGAGTGIFTKLLLERGSRVYVVEPNADMMGQAKTLLMNEYHANIKFINAPAENITLPDGCIDFITVAQAFHWFDLNKFKAECRRILKPAGKVVLIWNSKIFESDKIEAYDAVMRKFCPSFSATHDGFRGFRVSTSEMHINFFKGGISQYVTFRNDYARDYDSYIGNRLSSSYSLQEGDENYSEYIEALTGLFNRFSVDGYFAVPNITECYIGEV